MYDFLIRAIIASTGIAMITGLLSCFVVWKRMAYFGDSLAHSALLGVIIGLIVGINVNIGIIVTTFCFAILLTFLQSKRILSTDTLLGILAHGSLATGMIIISIFNFPAFNLHGLLFGDILTVTKKEILYIYMGVFIIYSLLILNWQKLVLIIIHQDLAQTQGINTIYLQFLIIFVMTVTVAVSINLIGILLITSMLIIPAATARQISISPNQMAIFSVIFALISTQSGIFLSYYFDIVSGPSIVFMSIILFILSTVVMRPILQKYRSK